MKTIFAFILMLMFYFFVKAISKKDLSFQTVKIKRKKQ